MPQATQQLRDKFPGGDREALTVLEANFKHDAGVFTKKTHGYVPTEREWDALDYLLDEWDYGYIIEPLP